MNQPEFRPLDPDVVRQVSQAVTRALAAEAGETWGDSPPVSLTETAEFIRAARTHRVAGLLAQHAERLALPEPVADRLRRTLVADSKAALKLTHETVRAHRALAHAGVPHVVMKGVPLSVVTTGSTTARGRGDVDLLVAEPDVAAAHRALRDAGWKARFGEAPRPGRPWRVLSRVDRELALDGANSSVDLHWRIDYDPTLFAPPERLIARAVTVDLMGEPIATLAPVDALGVSCLNVYIDWCSQLRGLVDVVRLCRLGDRLVPVGASQQQRQLVADVVQFTSELVRGVGPQTRRQVRALAVPSTGYLHELWAASSTRALHARSERASLPWLVARHRHMARYGRPVVGEARWLGKAVITSAVLDPGQGMWAVPRAMGSRVGQVVHRRPMHP